MPQRSPEPPRPGAGGGALQRGGDTFHQGAGPAARGRQAVFWLRLVCRVMRRNGARSAQCTSATSKSSVSLPGVQPSTCMSHSVLPRRRPHIAPHSGCPGPPVDQQACPTKMLAQRAHSAVLLLDELASAFCLQLDFEA